MSSSCKICLVGEMAVGKTSLANCYATLSGCEGYTSRSGGVHADLKIYRPNIGAHYVAVSQAGKNVFIWDTAGSERFRSMTPMYLRNANACLLVFSVTDKDSFREIKDYWVSAINKWSPETKRILVANKVDMKEDRQVSNEEIQAFCSSAKLLFYETSALTGIGVGDLFQFAIRVTQNSHEEKESFLDSIQLHERIAGLAEGSFDDQHVKKKKKIQCCPS